MSLYSKARIALRLARNPLRLDGSNYRVRGIFLNPLALRDASENREPWLDATLLAALSCREGAFLDVGANIGQTMLKVLALDKTRRYVGFEPQLACSFPIQRFIEDNDLRHFSILPFGLFTENQVMPLHRHGGTYDSMASLIDNFRPDSFYHSSDFVCVRKGDEVVEELNLEKIAVIKIDAEGAELEVLEGLEETIRREKPFIVFEVLNSFLVATGEKLDQEIIRFRAARIQRMEEIFRGQNYTVYRMGRTLVPVGPISPAVSDDLSLTNYIAVPPRECERFLALTSG